MNAPLMCIVDEAPAAYDTETLRGLVSELSEYQQAAIYSKYQQETAGKTPAQIARITDEWCEVVLFLVCGLTVRIAR